MVASLTTHKRVIFINPNEPFARAIDTALGVAAGLDESINPLLSPKAADRQVHWAIFGEVEGIPRPSFTIIQHVERESERADSSVSVPSITWSSYKTPIWTTEEIDESFLLHMSAMNVDVLVLNNLLNALGQHLRNEKMLDRVAHHLSDWATLNNALVIVAM